MHIKVNLVQTWKIAITLISINWHVDRQTGQYADHTSNHVDSAGHLNEFNDGI